MVAAPLPTNLQSQWLQRANYLSLSSARKLAREANKEAQKHYKHQYDKTAKNSKLKIGDWVLIYFPQDETRKNRTLLQPLHTAWYFEESHILWHLKFTFQMIQTSLPIMSPTMLHIISFRILLVLAREGKPPNTFSKIWCCHDIGCSSGFCFLPVPTTTEHCAQLPAYVIDSISIGTFLAIINTLPNSYTILNLPSQMPIIAWPSL